MITIGKPYIFEDDGLAYLKAKVKISSDIAHKYMELKEKLPNASILTQTDYPPNSWKDSDFGIWFCVDNKYKKYLCKERSDAFVIATLWYALATGSDIKYEAPLSKKLYNNLSNLHVPNKYYNNESIKLIGKTDCSKIWTEGKTGAGMSCGVDSIYTAINHSSQYKNEPPIIDYFTLFEDTVYYTDEKIVNIEQIYKRISNNNKLLLHKAKKVAKEMSLPLIYVRSNICKDLYRGATIYNSMYKFCSCAMAIQHLLSNYISSSSGHAKSLETNTFVASQFYEDLLIKSFRTETFNYIQSDFSTRINKIAEIINYPTFHDHLLVCTNNNCLECYGCWSTLFCIDFLDKLHLFSNIWDIEKFMKSRKKYYVMFLGFCKREECINAREILAQYKELCKKVNNDQCRLFLETIAEYE